MNTMKICSGCQKPLEANAPDGLCPECLLKAGLGTGVDIWPDSQAESGRTRFVALRADDSTDRWTTASMPATAGLEARFRPWHYYPTGRF